MSDFSAPLLPSSPPVADCITTFRKSRLETLDAQVLATSLQGLVNRERPRLYLTENAPADDRWIGGYYREKGYVREASEVDSLGGLVEAFGDMATGVVVWDPAAPYTLNTATNAAGVHGAIIVSPELMTQTTASHLNVVLDARELGLTCRYDAYRWELEHLRPHQRDDVSACLYDDAYLRDYLIQHRIHVFWKPGPDDAEFDPRLDELLVQTIRAGRPNTPILGFWFARESAPDGSDREVGSGELGGVRLAGEYGKYTLVSSSVANLSFHSGVRPPADTFRQSKVRSRPPRTVDREKTYVAWTMIDSGDAPMYYPDLIFSSQWDDPLRSRVPMSIGITPAMRALAPGVLQRLYESATEDQFFFCAISGIGYCYPLEGYARRTDDPDRVLTEYFERTEREMGRLDLDMLGLYSHPWTEWEPADDELVRRYITPRPGIRVVVADMGRNEGPTIGRPNRMLDNGTSIHHTLTRWTYNSAVDSVPFGPPADESRDHLAVAYLANELRTYGSGKRFVQAMFYSWSYGPRRLRMVMDQLEPEGYEFVTLYELDEMYRRSLGD